MKPNAFGPDEVRRLRGARSREAFARELGVTALSVYRWELPDGAPNARRPRGRILEALRSLEPRGRPVEAVPGDHARLWPVLSRLARGEWHSAEDELLRQLSSGELRSPAARALAAVAMASLQLWAHDEPRTAFATLAPHFEDAGAGRLPAEVEVQVHAVAAHIFGAYDGRLFDLGRVHAHVARAERLLPPFGASEVRCMLRVAEINAALYLGEPDLVRRAFEGGNEVLSTATEPALRCLAVDARAHEAILQGKGPAGVRLFQQAADEAAASGFAHQEARSYAFLAARRLDEAADPGTVLELTRRSREVIRSARLGPSFSDVFLARAEAEAQLRLARFDEARAALDEGERASQALAWPSVTLQPPRGRLVLYTGRAQEARTAAERLRRWDFSTARALSLAYADCLEGFAEWAEGAPDRAARQFDRARFAAEEARGWLFLQRECLVYGAGALLAAGDLRGAEERIRLGERVVERLPAAWWTALLRRTKGLLLCAQSNWVEGRQHLQAALGTFTLAGDLPEAILTRRALALAAEASGDPDAPALLARSGEEIARTGIVGAEGLRPAAVSARSLRPLTERHTDLDALVVPLKRLSVRGMNATLLQRELLAVAAELFPGRAVWLEEVDSSGYERRLAETGPEPRGGASSHVEFSDGTGRRLRLYVAGDAGSSGRSTLFVLSAFCSLAMEVSSLRGFAESAPPARPREDAVEIPGLVAASPVMKRLVADLARLAASKSTVIVVGESGAGKEVVARALHELSPRARRPCVAFNCASVPRDLFEGQLFGYRRGAFTGASSDHPGVIRAAHTGTLFLDEIGELPLDVQPKLLRFLENGEVLPLGETRPAQVDVRVVAATHRDLAALVREGRFREDLFYRLNVVPVRVPPLRERREEIVPLARHFVAQLSPPGMEPPTMSPDALATLAAWDWPGNIRELRNVIERALAFGPPSKVITSAQLRITA